VQGLLKRPRIDFNIKLEACGNMLSSLPLRFAMDAEAFEKSLRAFVRRRPFQSFVVELVSGARVEVDHPEALVFRGGVAIYVDPSGQPTLFDHHGVSQLTGSLPANA
jgi:hypothetical protein